MEITTSDKVKKAIVNQGRKKTWIADKLQLSRPTLDLRLEANTWQPEDIIRLKQIGILM